jgi:hypothetical protein
MHARVVSAVTWTNAQAWSLIREKEQLYRELFAPVFSEVAGFKTFSQQAHAAGLKVGVGTAGDNTILNLSSPT